MCPAATGIGRCEVFAHTWRKADVKRLTFPRNCPKMSPSMADVTELLARWHAGDAGAFEALMLRRLDR